MQLVVVLGVVGIVVGAWWSCGGAEVAAWADDACVATSYGQKRTEAERKKGRMKNERSSGVCMQRRRRYVFV